MSKSVSCLLGRKASTSNGGQRISFHILYHIHTIWLFTVGDLRTTCLQTVLFGLSGAASGRFTTPTRTDGLHPAAGAVALIGSLPQVFLFVWLLLLVSQLSNQSAVGAPEEDALNKPYRPIPAGRISQRQVRQRLMPPAILVALLLSFVLDVHWEAAVFIVLIYVYHDLGGADVPIARQLLNGAALALLGEGALKLAVYPSGGTVNSEGYAWTCGVGLVVATTVQTQDFRDQEGDAARGRRTLPLVVGDAPARWCTIASMLLWAMLVPWLCGAGIVGYLSSVFTAGIAVVSLAASRTPRADEQSCKLWSVWIANIYIMSCLSLLC
ncbi:hypothetical protein PG993_011970 [Apiospora rasikravindrae]|uniref:Uncharacterized protein n=1 Tax=Apiospora rasikravindrae TaxID=990691 RepID=A0ABR1S152_9PEZI